MRKWSFNMNQIAWACESTWGVFWFMSWDAIERSKIQFASITLEMHQTPFKLKIARFTALSIIHIVFMWVFNESKIKCLLRIFFFFQHLMSLSLDIALVVYWSVSEFERMKYFQHVLLDFINESTFFHQSWSWSEFFQRTEIQPWDLTQIKSFDTFSVFVKSLRFVSK